MLPGMELMGCADLAVPPNVMQHVVRVESSFNPYAIGVVGGRLARQPRNLPEAVSTARMLEREGYNFSLGLAQVNRYNLSRQGLGSYEQAFAVCPNLQAGARILAECYGRSGRDWGKALSCYYSGNFTTGFRHGYVQKVFASWQQSAGSDGEAGAIPLVERRAARRAPARVTEATPAPAPASRVSRRVQEAASREPASVVSAPAVAAPAAVAAVAAPVNATAAYAQPMPVQTPAAPVAVPGASSAPVVVQRVGASAAVARPSEAPPGAAPRATAAPERDDAFVF